MPLAINIILDVDIILEIFRINHRRPLIMHDIFKGIINLTTLQFFSVCNHGIAIIGIGNLVFNAVKLRETFQILKKYQAEKLM
ncbi:MAG: hypothetical protein EA359_19105 [Balneolaceae bacterium]|nr:MAG: hypothetical protein EA359_19105 [Balneolaceae bacterium]